MPERPFPAPNYDEALAGSAALPPLGLSAGATAADRAARQTEWREVFQRRVYGKVPPPPDRVAVTHRSPLPDGGERVTIRCSVGTRRMDVDAALWLPPGRIARRLIIGLDFLGPAGVLFDDVFPLDPSAIVAGVDAGLRDGRLSEFSRGVHASRWPLPMILGAGYGLLLTCYGSWTPDHAGAWLDRGVAKLFPDFPTGALSLWAWAASRLVDVAALLPETGAADVTLMGHSRLGKAVLWAGVNDPRVAGVIANNAGCLGPAPSRRNFGESPVHMRQRFPHWTVLGDDDAAHPENLPVDQHMLLACLAPRRLYVASASDDAWADPRGEFIGLRAALPAWRIEHPEVRLPALEAEMHPGTALRAGPLGWHLRAGGHGVTPWDWRHFL
jgi:hypothetical protein